MNLSETVLANRIAIFLLASFVCKITLADSVVPAAVTSKDISTFTNWPIILIVLIGMIGFIFSLGWFVRRFGGINFSGNREMKVVSSIALGTKERIALIDIKGRQFLIGVTSQQISHLHSFDEAVISTDTPNNMNKQNDFVTKLQAILNPVKNNDPVDLSASEKNRPENFFQKKGS